MTIATVGTPRETAPIRASVLYGAKPAISDQNVACDRCPTAAAKARIVFEAGPLYLCGHHLRTSWVTIMRRALEVSIDLPEKRFYLPAAPAEIEGVAR